jgi:8-oxo-dGTP pyrophosphatase MutT (NUDIX family)
MLFMENKNYFRGSEDHPWHLSVAGILVNEEGKIAVHHFKRQTRITINGRAPFNDTYVLMTETVEPNETMEQAVARGLMEEFGATGDFDTYVGSVRVSLLIHEKINYQRTILYFLVRCTSIDDTKRSEEDLHLGATTEWLTPDEVIEKFTAQINKYPNYPMLMDEVVIIEKVKPLI